MPDAPTADAATRLPSALAGATRLLLWRYAIAPSTVQRLGLAAAEPVDMGMVTAMVPVHIQRRSLQTSPPPAEGEEGH
ncbi:hypothetical protein E2562_014894 [Oryza meyeriana var. granulata]|uniref:Uncharacterized protein n=1 Tax=Oryza meyeriana var. granulata TaxID=110450 RepID=A0A6G1EJ68_9ORYZ|nr:hypothetical protein E2562_014894 [Oryza meyeriana var. granulata]